MPDRDRNEHGRFADWKDPETVLDVFEARTDPCEPLDAGDVADELGWARRTALKKLDALSEEGVLADKKIGARGRVWWIPAEDLGLDYAPNSNASVSHQSLQDLAQEHEGDHDHGETDQ